MLADKLKAGWNMDKTQEDTFCVNSFDMFASPFISCIPGTRYNGRDHMLDESKKRKMKLAELLKERRPYVMGRKPDRSISVSIRGDEHHVLLCELKIKAAAKDRGDLVKLGTEMKDCLDGILSKKCQTFIILYCRHSSRRAIQYPVCHEFAFNFMYQMINVYSCTFPSNIRDISTLDETLTLFSHARKLAETSVVRLNDRSYYQDEDSGDRFDTSLVCRAFRDAILKYRVLYSRNLLYDRSQLYKIEKITLQCAKITRNIDSMLIVKKFLERFEKVLKCVLLVI